MIKIPEEHSSHCIEKSIPPTKITSICPSATIPRMAALVARSLSCFEEIPVAANATMRKTIAQHPVINAVLFLR